MAKHEQNEAHRLEEMMESYENQEIEIDLSEILHIVKKTCCGFWPAAWLLV
jgi:hypothetical protein